MILIISNVWNIPFWCVAFPLSSKKKQHVFEPVSLTFILPDSHSTPAALEGEAERVNVALPEDWEPNISQVCSAAGRNTKNWGKEPSNVNKNNIFSATFTTNDSEQES